MLRISGGRPTLSQDETLDEDKVSEFVKWFIKNDPFANVISNRSANIIFEAGYAPIVPLGYNPSKDKRFDNLTDWFLAKLVQDIKNLREASETDFKDFLDKLGDASSKTLITHGVIAHKYYLNFEKFVYEKEIQKIPAGKERELFKQNLMDDDILGAELRILGWLYHEWFGDWYKIPEKEDANFCGSCGFSQQEAIVKEENKGIIGQFLELFKLSFNWSGRFSRRQFITYNVGIFFIVFFNSLLIVLTGLHVQIGSTEWYVLLTLAAIGQISNSIAVIRRLHDLDISGWYYLLIHIWIVLDVLIIFFVCYIYLLVKKGKEIGETRWG